jgi:hypothetical protein
MLKLPQSLAALARLASSAAHARFDTTSLLVRETAAGFNVAATNGRILGVVRGDSGNLPATARLARHEGGLAEVLVPARDWQRVLKQAGNGGTNAVLGARGITFDLGDGTETVLHQAGRFPDVSRLLGAQRSVLRVKVDARQLVALLQAATAFADPNSAIATLHLQASGNPLLVTATDGAGLEFEGCICPIA